MVQEIEHGTVRLTPMGEPGSVDDGLNLPIVKAPMGGAAAGRQSGRRRNRQVIVRMTPEERGRLAELAEVARTSVSRFVLDSTVYAEAVRLVPTKGELRQIMVELRRQGNNLNQIARAINSGQMPVSAESSRTIAEECSTIRESWAEILRTWSVVMAELDGVLP